MLNPVIKIRFKLTLLTLLTISLIYLVSSFFKENLIAEVVIFILLSIYFLKVDRERLFTLLTFFYFLARIIILLHAVYFIFRGFTMGWDYSINFYNQQWKLIIIRIFLIPNLMGIINILISRFDFIDIILITNSKNYSRIFYILMISGIEVMRRLKIHYEYHPLNYQSRFRDKVIHYLAIPLTLFFGIYRGFESRYLLLLQRDEVLTESLTKESDE